MGVRRAGCLGRRLLAFAAIAAFALWPAPAKSQDATWESNPTVDGPTAGTFDFNADENWIPDTVPTGTAFFDETDEPDISFSADTTIGGWTFNADADDYDFTNDQELTFVGAGIAVNGGSATINNNFGGLLDFSNNSSAANATIILNNSFLDFNDTSTAGSADITNNAGVVNFNDNSRAGSATINNDAGGTLDFNDSSTAGSATIINNGELDFNLSSSAGTADITNNSDLEFFSNSTAGSATITNSPGATQTFRNNSTAGSATIINNEDLEFFSNSTAGSATIVNDDFLQFNLSSSAGSATIINESGGALNFNNTSTAGTATIVNDDNLSFFDTSTAGSATITNNNAQLTFSATSTAGSATITGENISFNDTSTAGTANITNTGLMQFTGSSTAGSATIINNENVAFSQNSTGGQAQFINNAGHNVFFSAGTGPAGDGRLTAGSLAGAGNYLLGDNELTVGGNNLSSTASGVISGTGAATGTSLIKTGTGTFTLSGANTYTGATMVNQGTLVVDGSIVSPVTVNTGGTLGGTGQVGAVMVNNGGIYAPGNSIGTQTVNGNFTLNAGAILQIEANAARQSDQIVVTNNGSVNLTGAILQVLAQNGNYASRTDYLIIDNDGADPVVGQFGLVTTNLAFLTPSVIYNGGTGNDVVLTLERTSADFCSVAQTPNQCNVAMALEQFPINNPLFLAVLNQTVAGARQAFDALSGEIHASVAGTLADDSRYVREAILGRLMQANATSAGSTQVAALGAAGPQVASLDSKAMALGTGSKSVGEGMPAYERAPLAFWTRAYGAWGDFDGDGNAATADRDLGGFVSGMDAQVSGSWRAGLATGASFANVSVGDRFSSADVESYILGGYTGGMAGAFALRGGGTFAWNDIDTSRAVIFPGFFERQNASYDADTGQIFGEVAYPTQVGGLALEPFAGLAYVAIDTDSIRERGGALASLRGSAEDQDVGYSTVGLRAATTMQFGGMQIVPHVSAAWQHAFDDVTPGAALAFATTGIGFAIEGVPLAEDTALIDAGLDFALGPNTSAGVSYSGQFGGGVTDNAAKGRVTWLF